MKLEARRKPLSEQLAELNAEQHEAVIHFEGPILVLAGAGSGKTRVLTTRIAYLVEEMGVDPARILAVTFTNKAAAEMRARIRRLLGQDPAGAWIGTFHSIGARLLRRHAGVLGWAPNFSIFDADDALREVKRVMEAKHISRKQWNPKAVHAAISAAKNQLVNAPTYAEQASDAFSRIVAGVYEAYEDALKRQNALDFDDLLVKPVALLARHERLLERYRERFGFVLVDEYQDTNHAQYRLLQLIAGEHGNLMVVGDDDQSIYGWRGADVSNILGFEKDFPGAKLVRLEQNYRSTGRILDAANHVIEANIRRKGKTLRTSAGPGERLTLTEAADERDEADWIAAEIEMRLATVPAQRPRDFVLLYRTNAQSRALEEGLRRRDLPYQIIGGTRFYERREIMDTLAYLRLVSNPRDASAFDRIVNYPRRGIGDTSRARLMEWAAERGLPLLDAASRADECDGLRSAATESLIGFAAQMRRYAALAPELTAGPLVELVVDEMGIYEALRNEGPEGVERIENVRELVAGAHEFDDAAERDAAEQEDVEDVEAATAIDLFLQKISLITDVDRHDPEADALTLMTLHNAKGLEYPVVFITGLEDGLFPLARVFDEPADLEEERRLFYVGITRAERKLYLTHARMRRRAGEVTLCKASSFLDPIPESLIERRATPAVDRARRDGATGWRTPRSARARTSSWDDGYDGVHVDYSDSQDLPRFVKGERVRHPQFGAGVIRELSGFGRELRVVVDFERVGRKKIVARYANLQKEF